MRWESCPELRSGALAEVESATAKAIHPRPSRRCNRTFRIALA
jgi:hypothetical protein